jgi:beta-1,4-mannosyltransferase
VLVTRLLGGAPELATSDALRALSSLDWTGATQPGGRRPGVVAYLPVFRGNPFQALLYSGLPAAGMRALPLYDVGSAAAFADAAADPGLDLVVHPHWLNVVTAKATDERAAREASKVYLEALHGMRDRGARILWTVHNILPHESRFPDVEAELRRGVVDVAERVHVMSPRTRELVAPWFEIPEEKLLVVPHPGYHGVYPSWMPRVQARLELGIAPDAVVFLLIGRVKPYKGLTELIDAFDELARRRPGRFVLLVAGPPGREEETAHFRERALAHPAVFAALRKIPDDEMQVYLRAADVAVFPYRRSLNSGALALTQTFGLPAILPAHSGEAATVEESYAEVYDGEDPGGLLAALSAAERLLAPEARAAAAAAGEQIAAPVVAGRFAAELRAWLDGRPQPDAQPVAP